MMGHGWGKLLNLLQGEHGFPDPLGVGALPSLILAVLAEFFCAAAVVLGFRVRWTAWPLVVTMLVAAFVFHAGDGWGKQEFPLLYALVFAAIGVGGPGRWALRKG